MFSFFQQKSMSNFDMENNIVSFNLTAHLVVSAGILGVIVLYNYLRQRRNDDPRVLVNIRP